MNVLQSRRLCVKVLLGRGVAERTKSKGLRFISCIPLHTARQENLPSFTLAICGLGKGGFLFEKAKKHSWCARFNDVGNARRIQYRYRHFL